MALRQISPTRVRRALLLLSAGQSRLTPSSSSHASSSWRLPRHRSSARTRHTTEQWSTRLICSSASTRPWQRQFPRSAGMQYGLGFAYAKAEDPRAKPYLVRAVEFNRRLARAYQQLSLDAKRWGNDLAANRYIAQAAAADPASPDYAFEVAYSYHDTDPARWRAGMEDVIRRFPVSERAPQALYWLAFGTNSDSERTKVLERLLREFPAEKLQWTMSGMEILYAQYVRRSQNSRPRGAFYAGLRRRRVFLIASIRIAQRPAGNPSAAISPERLPLGDKANPGQLARCITSQQPVQIQSIAGQELVAKVRLHGGIQPVQVRIADGVANAQPSLELRVDQSICTRRRPLCPLACGNCRQRADMMERLEHARHPVTVFGSCVRVGRPVCRRECRQRRPVARPAADCQEVDADDRERRHPQDGHRDFPRMSPHNMSLIMYPRPDTVRSNRGPSAGSSIFFRK